METQPTEFSIYIRKTDIDNFVNAEVVVFKELKKHTILFNKFVRETSKKMETNLFGYIITKDDFFNKYDNIKLTDCDEFDIKIDKLFSVKKHTYTGESSLVKILGYDVHNRIMYYRVMNGVSIKGNQILSPSIIGADIDIFLKEHYKIST